MGTVALTRRLPTPVRAVVACAAVTLVATACGSSTHGAGTTTRPTPVASSTSLSAAPTSAPSSSGPAPITLPSRSPAPVVTRTVTRPAGLSKVSEQLCIGAVVSNAATDNLRRAMTDYSQLDEQVNQVGGAAGELEGALPGARALRAAFVAAKYPTSFPVVQDLTELIAVESGVLNAWHSRNLAPIPSLYLRLSTASKQFLADTGSAFRSGRDVCG